MNDSKHAIKSSAVSQSQKEWSSGQPKNATKPFPLLLLCVPLFCQASKAIFCYWRTLKKLLIVNSQTISNSQHPKGNGNCEPHPKKKASTAIFRRFQRTKKSAQIKAHNWEINGRKTAAVIKQPSFKDWCDFPQNYGILTRQMTFFFARLRF